MSSPASGSTSVVGDKYRLAQQMLLDRGGYHGTAGFGGDRQFGNVHRVDREDITVRRVAFGGTGSVILVGAKIGAALLRLFREQRAVRGACADFELVRIRGQIVHHPVPPAGGCTAFVSVEQGYDEAFGACGRTVPLEGQVIDCRRNSRRRSPCTHQACP